jgi:expansin (peptidoglycan-binding protein)
MMVKIAVKKKGKWIAVRMENAPYPVMTVKIAVKKKGKWIAVRMENAPYPVMTAKIAAKKTQVARGIINSFRC